MISSRLPSALILTGYLTFNVLFVMLYRFIASQHRAIVQALQIYVLGLIEPRKKRSERVIQRDGNNGLR